MTRIVGGCEPGASGMVGSGMGTVRVRTEERVHVRELACACSAGAGEYWSKQSFAHLFATKCAANATFYGSGVTLWISGDTGFKAASRIGRRAPTPTITTDRRLARPCGEQKFGSLRACRMLCDVWTLARNARKLAFHPWARGRTAVVGSLCDAPIGSSTSSPATSQHGSSLDGSLLSMLSAFCTASPGSL